MLIAEIENFPLTDAFNEPYYFVRITKNSDSTETGTSVSALTGIYHLELITPGIYTVNYQYTVLGTQSVIEEG